MSRRVSISMKAAQRISDCFVRATEAIQDPTARGAVQELRRAMERKRRAATKFFGDGGPAKGAASAARRRKDERRRETASIWEACWERCGGFCECGCGQQVFRPGDVGSTINTKAELEHPFSKGKGARLPQSVETCWILRADCHRERTNNRPDAATWWKKFLDHCRGHMSISRPVLEAARARLRFVETRRSLPAAPRAGP